MPSDGVVPPADGAPTNAAGDTPASDFPAGEGPSPSGTPPPADAGSARSARGGGGTAGGGRRRPPKPPGLREQVGATFDALTRMIRAHTDLARAEMDEIKGEIGRAAGLGGAAIVLLILLAFLLPIGLILFTGEWLFGSIGWGVLLGSELLVAVAIMLVALRVPRLGIDLFLAFVIGLIVSVVLGLNLPNQLWRAIGDALNLGDPAWRALATGALVMGIVGALVGLVMGARARDAGSIVGGLVAGFIMGALLGAFLAITFGWQVGIALGTAVGLGTWSALMAARVARDGIDEEALKARFVPQATIDTTKETIEWAKTRVPFGPKS
jgi:hypothetical protein